MGLGFGPPGGSGGANAAVSDPLRPPLPVSPFAVAPAREYRCGWVGRRTEQIDTALCLPLQQLLLSLASVLPVFQFIGAKLSSPAFAFIAAHPYPAKQAARQHGLRLRPAGAACPAAGQQAARTSGAPAGSHACWAAAGCCPQAAAARCLGGERLGRRVSPEGLRG